MCRIGQEDIIAELLAGGEREAGIVGIAIDVVELNSVKSLLALPPF